MIKNFLTWIIVIVFLGIYYVLTSITNFLDPMLFPPLDKIVSIFVISLPKLFESLGSSIRLLLPGFGLALILGISLGLIIGMNRLLKKAVMPIIFALNPIPPSIITPYLIALLPTFYFSSVAVIFIGCFWPILNGTIVGLSLIEQKYLDFSKLLELDKSKYITKVLLPGAAPSILSGIKTSLNFAFILLVVAEMFATSSGLGYFIQYYADFSDYARVISGIFFMATFIVLVMQIFEVLRKRILFWTLNKNN